MVGFSLPHVDEFEGNPHERDKNQNFTKKIRQSIEELLDCANRDEQIKCVWDDHFRMPKRRAK